MPTWSEGYTSDITYTYGYYAELSVQNMIIPLLNAGIALPKIRHACELGFGQGVSINIHAAGGNAQWYGTDFNPSQVSFASNLSEQAGTSNKLHLSDQSFAEFCQRDDLPGFDYICLHGIWSWISDENRHIIVDFLRRKLNVGGVLYISYNSLPGWSANMPFRHLLAEFDRQLSGNNTREVAITQSIQQVGEVLKLSSRLLNQSPNLLKKVEQVSTAKLPYLAHEYLNQDWNPMYFTQVEQYLKEAKLSFACSAFYLDDYAGCLFDSEQQAYLAEIKSPSLRETIKDYFLNRQFRRDYWIKGGRKLNESELLAQWKALSVMFVGDISDKTGVITHYRELHIIDSLLQPLLDILKDRQVHKVADLLTTLKDTIEPQQLFSILSLLVAKTEVIVVQDEETVKAVKQYCHALNRYVLEYARHDKELLSLAVPVSGGAISLNRIEQLFLLAHVNHFKQDEWVSFVWGILKAQDVRLVQEGKTLSSDEENVAVLEQQKALFVEKKFPLLQRLQLV